MKEWHNQRSGAACTALAITHHISGLTFAVIAIAAQIGPKGEWERLCIQNIVVPALLTALLPPLTILLLGDLGVSFWSEKEWLLGGPLWLAHSSGLVESLS